MRPEPTSQAGALAVVLAGALVAVACAPSGVTGGTEAASTTTGAPAPQTTTTTALDDEDDGGFGLGFAGGFDLPGVPAAVAVDGDRDVGYVALTDGRILGFVPSLAAGGVFESSEMADGLEHPRGLAISGDVLVAAELGSLPCPGAATECRGGDLADDPAEGDAFILAASSGRLTSFPIGVDGSLGERSVLLDGLPVAGSDAGPRAIASGPDGSVYVAIGDADLTSLEAVAAVGHPSAAWLGVVLKVDVDSGETGVVASGFRGPSGIAVAADGSLFAVDRSGPALGGWRFDELVEIGEGARFGYPDDGTFGEWTARTAGAVWILDPSDPGPMAWGADAGLGDVALIGSCGNLEAVSPQPIGDTWFVRSPFRVHQLTRVDGCVAGVAAIEPRVVFAAIGDGSGGRLIVLSPEGDPDGITLGSVARSDDDGVPIGLTVVAERATTGAGIAITVDLDRDLGFIAFGEGRIVRFRPSEMAQGVFEFDRVADGLEFPRGLAIAGDLLAVTEMGPQVCDDPFPTCLGMDLSVDRPEGERLILEASRGRLVVYAIGDDGSLSDRRVLLDDLPVANSYHAVNDVELGPDGMLYVALGHLDDLIYDREMYESTVHPNKDLLGTVLRVDPATGDFDVFASGTRNVFGLAFATDGSLWATDNDGRTWSTWRTEEVIRIEEGDDFGHPFEGSYGPWEVRTAPPVFSTSLAGSSGVAWGEDAGLGSTLLIGSCGRLQALGLERVGGEWVVADAAAYREVMPLAGCATGIVVGPDGRVFVVVNARTGGMIYVLGRDG